MNRERAKMLAPVFKAYGDGKMVQLRRIGARWEDLESAADFENESVEWRIKPEIRVFWIDAGTKKAYTEGQLMPSDNELIYVREVLDDE